MLFPDLHSEVLSLAQLLSEQVAGPSAHLDSDALAIHALRMSLRSEVSVLSGTIPQSLLR